MLDENQRHELGKAMFDIAKLSFAITVATPLVTSGIRAWGVAMVGGVFVLTMLILATTLVKKEEN